MYGNRILYNYFGSGLTHRLVNLLRPRFLNYLMNITQRQDAIKVIGYSSFSSQVYPSNMYHIDGSLVLVDNTGLQNLSVMGIGRNQLLWCLNTISPVKPNISRRVLQYLLK